MRSKNSIVLARIIYNRTINEENQTNARLQAKKGARSQDNSITRPPRLG